jgi:hypothetical protein
MLVFILLSLVSGQSNYEYLRDYIEGFMKGYEDPTYTFPSSSCLSPRVQTSINDKIIGLFFFASNENWAQVNLIKSQLQTVIKNALKSCDLDDFYLSTQESYSFSTWLRRLWWNSVLIFRNCSKFQQLLLSNRTGAFYHLGTCMKFIFPKVIVD